MIINALIIVFLLWFLYQRFAPVKGIQQIATTELKAKLKKKITSLSMCEHRMNFVPNILKDFETFLYQNCQSKQASFQKTEK